MDVNNLFLFKLFEEVIHDRIKFDESWYKNKLESASGLLYPKLRDAMPFTGNEILGDSRIACTICSLFRGWCNILRPKGEPNTRNTQRYKYYGNLHSSPSGSTD